MARSLNAWMGQALAALALLVSAGAWAQAGAYPNRPVKIIVPSAPGGPADIILRTINARMADELKQPVVLEYRPGASGTIALNSVARSPADGYTLVLVSETHTAAESLYPKRGYSMEKDLAPVAMLASMPSVLVVNKNLPVKSVAELLALAKAQPGKLSFASGGNGNVYHLAAELMQQKANVRFLHVPYSQASTGRTDLLAGQVDMMFDALVSMQPQITAGTVRALAVTSAQRLPSLPGVPTIAEAGVPGYEMEIWFGLMAPPGVSPQVLNRLNDVISAAVQDKAVVAQFTAGAMTPLVATPQTFADLIRVSIGKWADVVKAGAVKVD
ncbi:MULTISPECIES: Bug family tripartite tricarboxylate transporter substrate binding protein [Ramlibacter]|uniref:Tripartite tricarboxylate transporter substrate binding protein n=1 Tax=Ramlibacter pinisoli TaxID=2682844 RepID=A0A6N8IZ88_9BURK|nr:MULTISPECIES: tripartite tricarboxylate transporter substrate binding protein [Ramlibacter]MBA2961416.1 tripartite tricarboxylate transporter substrate binding protein [Ramlibacter sp. CGMCC 1.13660]MVQ31360.1 tripartite tricarboxylate transporter substrate binding protein [Ramlibacter pinisoli]